MFSFLLFFVTSIVGILQAYTSLLTAYWGVPTVFSQYASLFGGIILFGSSILFLFFPRLGFLLACISSLLISTLYVHFVVYVFSNYSLKKIFSHLSYTLPLLPFFLLVTLSILVSFLGYTGLGRKKYPYDFIFPPNQPLRGGIYVTILIILVTLIGSLGFILGVGREVSQEFSARVVKWDKKEILATLEEFPAYSISGVSQGILNKFTNPKTIQVKILFIKDFSTLRSHQVLEINGISLKTERASFFLFKSCDLEGFISCSDPLAQKNPFD